ncbi:hypothetical protein MFFC18_18790 [Mariniblastus fucicola]|uniref:Uncharacterized protein n=1 Tax=Mariniblastus fucicola TaxID=980251 RepID=A0A5B9P6W6_9BACT|nr:hypothetical protein MFFC18_18300 [Mariniblastus fucicola]QEG22018.1 hypothetical protein MFFC18_18790 [Mariniblastus fucicola]
MVAFDETLHARSRTRPDTFWQFFMLERAPTCILLGLGKTGWQRKPIQRSLRRHAATRYDVHFVVFIVSETQCSTRMNDRRADVQMLGLHLLQ